MRPSLDQLRAIPNTTELYRWYLTVAQFPQIGSWPSSQALNFRCISTDLPKRTIE